MIRNFPILSLGAGVQMLSFTIGFADLAATSGAGAKLITLTNSDGSAFSLPAGSVVIGVRAKHSAAFVGTSLTALTSSLCKTTGSVTFFTPAFDVFQAVADGTLQETALFKAGQLTGFSLAVNFIPTGANCSACTAGAVTYDILVAQLSTPNPL